MRTNTEIINENKIEAIILAHIRLEKIYVFSDDANNYQIIAVDPIFSKMSVLEAHKVIYAPLTKYISENKIHAVSIKVFDPENWKKYHKLYINNI